MIKEKIIELARSSKVRSHYWKPNRGPAKAGYITGMALVYGRVHCKWKQQNPVALEIAKAARPDSSDGLSLYKSKFAETGMDNSSDGVDTLRHTFVLLMGLGMMESSGRYCEGRDRDAENKKADTAEAGLFQTSWNARSAHALLPGIFEVYANDPRGFAEVFAEGIVCKDDDWENFGTGAGRDFQQLSKTCPAFAVEFSALAIRHKSSHWGPLKGMHCEIRKECDALFREVQNAIDASASACAELT